MQRSRFFVGVGLQTLNAAQLERAARHGRRVHGVALGLLHLSRDVSPELADRTLGRIMTLGIRTGFGRVQRASLRGTGPVHTR
ncbi:MAG TPA: hypothetical protein VNG13_13635 [Mycobacteriales bacterium]|nr:hypothetical protein [Mycobacteriales bacterium]